MNSLKIILENDDLNNFILIYKNLIDYSLFPEILKNNCNIIGISSYYGAMKCYLFLEKNGYENINCDNVLIY